MQFECTCALPGRCVRAQDRYYLTDIAAQLPRKQPQRLHMQFAFLWTPYECGGLAFR